MSRQAIVGTQPTNDVVVYGIQAATFFDLGFPPFNVVTPRIVRAEIRSPPTRASAPSVTDPLRRYPKSAETVKAVAKVGGMDYVIVG